MKNVPICLLPRFSKLITNVLKSLAMTRLESRGVWLGDLAAYAERRRGSLAIKRRDHLSAVLFCNELPVHGEFHSIGEGTRTTRVRLCRHCNRGLFLAIIRQPLWSGLQHIKRLWVACNPSSYPLLDGHPLFLN